MAEAQKKIEFEKLNGNSYLYEVITEQLDRNHQEIKADLKLTLEAFSRLKDSIDHLVTSINTAVDLVKYASPYIFKFAIAILVLLGGLVGVKLF